MLDEEQINEGEDQGFDCIRAGFVFSHTFKGDKRWTFGLKLSCL